MDYNKQELKPITEWDGTPRWMFVWDNDSKDAAVRFVCDREQGFWLARRYPDPREKLHLYNFVAEIPSSLIESECYKTKLLYLSGAITNNPNYKQDFEAAYKKLIKSGYSVVSPIIFCNDDWDWNTCMRKCLEILSRNKNLSIALIDNQYESKGRDLELAVAKTLGLEIKTVDEWIKGAM